MDQKNIDLIRATAIQLSGVSSDYNALIEYIDDAQIVLLGEASHGTHEFYDIRAKITQRLISEKHFNAIAIEGDWPDAYNVNQYIHSREYGNAMEALASFDKFPTWMWRNIPMVKCIDWLKNYNEKQNGIDKIGFYGLDVYSMYRSIDLVIKYLDKIDHQAAAEARHYYSCFNRYRHDPQSYAYAVFTKVIQSCAEEVVDQLKRLQEKNWKSLKNGEPSAEEVLYIEQNARVVKNAEAYYRSLFINEESSWNLRDSHMYETLNSLIEYYQRKGIMRPKIVVWAHNSHIGNAKATQMGTHGEYNIGQLVKEQFGRNAISVGFTTYEGTVSAASDWHAPIERKHVRKALPNSYESLFHATQLINFLLILKNKKIVPNELLERAIGVVYRPESERVSHYFHANLTEQFDAIIHCDKTHAVEPLEKTSQWISGEIPETYPSGL